MSDPLVTLSAKVPADLRDAVHEHALGLGLSVSAAVAHLLGRALGLPMPEPVVSVPLSGVSREALEEELRRRAPAVEALTNCDSCAHDRHFLMGRMCSLVDGPGADSVSAWAFANCADGGVPRPGATRLPWVGSEGEAMSSRRIEFEWTMPDTSDASWRVEPHPLPVAPWRFAYFDGSPIVILSNGLTWRVDEGGQTIGEGPTLRAAIKAAGLYFATMDDGAPLRGEEDGA